MSFSQLSAALAPAAASAQDWPAKPVTLVVPFSPGPGNGTDAFAEPLAAHLSKQLGRQVIIDHKGGAGGTVGASFAAKQAPDGYTWFVGSVHHAIAPSFYPELDYDIERDLIPVAMIANPPQVIVANAHRMPFNNVKELIDHMKKNPAAKYSYGSAGNGTLHHLAGELFKQQAGVSIVHRPYPDVGSAMQHLADANVDLMFDGLGFSGLYMRAGAIKALAVASPKRSQAFHEQAFHDVPTAAETGLPNYNVSTWYGIWAVKGTPQPIVERMRVELAKALASLEIIKAWANYGSYIPTMTQAEFAQFLNAEIKRWAVVTKASGAKLD
jgi:tripartite-type tricarboxylate transporter receptor subunit TctC